MNLEAKSKVRMLTCTDSPLAVMSYAWDVMKNDVPDTLEEYIHEHDPTPDFPDFKRKNEEFFEQKFVEILKDGLGTPSEYVNTVWVFKNVSRAFQQQLTRYRVGTSFSIQSLRRVDVRNFADKGLYHTPSRIKGTPAEGKFHETMEKIQKSYVEMLESGSAIEDARGILPLNIYSTITASISLRSLANIVKQRTCTHTQEEWKEVIKQMKKEVEARISPVVAEELFKAPCERTGVCDYPDRCCGKVYGKKPVFCKYCGEPISGEYPMVLRDGDYACPSCYEKHNKEISKKEIACAGCGKILTKAESWKVWTQEKGAETCCKECAEKRARLLCHCESCGKTLPSNKLFKTLRGYFCETCMGGRKDDRL